ncbi:MAG: cysteine--tRNA ligase [Candidatus Micrarchaeota archaeon]
MLTVYNTLSKRKEAFKPLKPGVVTMYVCGVTPYDYAHLGHARAAVSFDNMRRFLELQGFKVTHLTNFTDVDDKIIKRSNEEGESCEQIASKYIDDYQQAMRQLHVLPPVKYALATEHVPEMHALIKTLETKGFAYPAGGDVYYSVAKFREYGKLSGTTVEQLRAGARVEPGEYKRAPEDFALWKVSKPGEPTWESPYGAGRPGWHIECSAMIAKQFNGTIDIHGGGSDLIFPHHENEIAQSEAATGKPLAKYWLHCGLLQTGDEKMSKSLKNYFSLKDALAKHDAEAIRLFMAGTHYRQPLKYSPQSLAESEVALARLNNCRAALEEAIGEENFGSAKTAGKIAALEKSFVEAMEDDFNTANALAAVFDLAKLINSQVTGKATAGDSKLALETLEKLGKTLGLFNSPSRKQLPAGVKREWLEKKIAEREEARASRDYAKADAIRKELAGKGIALEDTAKGPRWRAE